MNKCLCCHKPATVPFGISLDQAGEVIAYKIWLCWHCYEIFQLLKYKDIQEYVAEKKIEAGN